MLDYLPPYSPELNPIERVWKLTRRQCIHNRYFPALEEVLAAVETQFGYWASGNEALRRVCAITYDAAYREAVRLSRAGADSAVRLVPESPGASDSAEAAVRATPT